MLHKCILTVNFLYYFWNVLLIVIQLYSIKPKYLNLEIEIWIIKLLKMLSLPVCIGIYRYTQDYVW